MKIISIIVPVYNAKNYLQAAVDSVLSQTYKDFELILINDGSSDGSFELMQNIKNSDARIKVYTQENKGVTAARKLGWLNAIGDYITFLDADDALIDNSLEILIRNASQDNFDIINGAFISVPSARNWQHKILGELSKSDYLKSLVFGYTYGVLYASLYKKELFRESTFSFDTSIKIGEDVLLNIEICERVSKIKNIEEVVYKYTDDNNSSAMKIIIRHPYYYFRYNLLRNDLIRNIDEVLYYEMKEELDFRDNDIIVETFFSPFFKFDTDLFVRLKSIRKKTKKNILSVALANKYLTILLKNYFSIIFLIKNFILRKKHSKKHIIC